MSGFEFQVRYPGVRNVRAVRHVVTNPSSQKQIGSESVKKLVASDQLLLKNSRVNKESSKISH